MLTDHDLQELLGYKAQHPVLSVYLNTDPSEGSADAYKLRLRTMLKGNELREDVAEIERFFNHQNDWSGRSLAVFSCAPENYFRAYPLAVPVRDRVRINSQPYVKPLAQILDAFGGYGVALVDKQGARIFHIHLGEIKEQEGVLGEEVRHTKRGGASTFPGRRGGVAGQTNYAEEVAERNMREAADFAAHFFAEKNVRRVLLAGTDDNLALFRGLLPKVWQSLIVGTFPMSMTASKNEVLERALLIGQDAEHRREIQLVDAAVTGAAKGRGGVIRLDDTLTAVHEGRVHTLLITDGFRAPGYRCQGCGYVTAQKLDSCPFCGKNFEQIPDAVEMAVHKVMELGGDVEVLPNGESGKEFGNIAGLLRY
jgi:peptide subunit release factor 1 (eRF1)